MILWSCISERESDTLIAVCSINVSESMNQMYMFGLIYKNIHHILSWLLPHIFFICLEAGHISIVFNMSTEVLHTNKSFIQTLKFRPHPWSTFILRGFCTWWMFFKAETKYIPFRFSHFINRSCEEKILCKVNEVNKRDHAKNYIFNS